MGSLTLKVQVPKYLGIWDLGSRNYSTGFGQVYDYWVLAPLGLLRRQQGFLLLNLDEGDDPWSILGKGGT